MTVKELEAYQIICSRGSLNKAAKELFITPQGLGRVLKNLEAELECTLVNRGASGLELTESGKCLLEYARLVTSDYEKLQEMIENIQGSVHGSVDLLMAYDVVRVFDPACFEGFRQLYPGISVFCREFPDRIAEQMLLDGQGTAAISIGPFDRDVFHVRPLFHCPLHLVVYEGHPLCGRKEATIADLKGEPLFLENSSFKINEYVQSQCWHQGFEPNIAFETSGFDICCRLCRMKKGITVVPDVVYQDMKTDGLVQLPFADRQLELEVALLTRKETPGEQGVDKLYHYLKNRQKERL